jgi:flagellar motor switch protein FliG
MEKKMTLKTRDLSGIDKAAVLLMSLGASKSAKVFEHLNASERELLGAHIAGLRHVDDVIRQAVMGEVSQLVRGEQPAETTIDDGHLREPLKWLERLDPVKVAHMLGSERPQNVALVLAHLAPQAAAAVLSCLDEGIRNQAASRLVDMRTPSREVVEAVDEVMRRRFAGPSSRSRNAGRESLIGILGNAKDLVKESITGAFAKPGSNCSEEIASPEDLIGFTDSDIRRFISEVDREDLYLALRVASDELKSVIIENASEELALTIHRELASPLQIRLREIESAQERFINAMRRIRNEAESNLRVSTLGESVEQHY